MNAPPPASRGVGVRLNYKGLSLATGGILAEHPELLLDCSPKSFPLWGLYLVRNFYLESDVYEPTTEDLQAATAFR